MSNSKIALFQLMLLTAVILIVATVHYTQTDRLNNTRITEQKEIKPATPIPYNTPGILFLNTETGIPEMGSYNYLRYEN